MEADPSKGVSIRNVCVVLFVDVVSLSSTYNVRENREYQFHIKSTRSTIIMYV